MDGETKERPFDEMTSLEAQARRRREAETLRAAMQALSATLDLQEIFDLFLQLKLRALFKPEVKFSKASTTGGNSHGFKALLN